MSGSTIGGIAGALVGSFFGPLGAKIGWMVGSLVGGYVDPQKIEGPRLKDATRQTSQDGIPIPFGYGSFPTTGNLIWTDRLVETKSTKRQGKGGPKVTEYTYTRSYAIGVCEGEIAGYLIVKRNGKIVYDTRTTAELTAAGYTSAQIAESRAAQAKWQEVATLYYGNEVQLPDPTITAVKGAGNVPAYRGLAYIVLTDEDLTQERGAVPQYEFVVSVCGERTEEAAPGDERFMAFGVAAAGFRAASRPLDYSINWVGASDADVYATNSTTAFGFAVFGGKAFSATRNGYCAVAELSALDTWTPGPTGSASASLGSGLVATAGKLWQAAGTAGVKYLNAATDVSFQTVASFGGAEITCIVGVDGGVVAASKLGLIYAAPSGTSFTQVNDRYLPAGMEIKADCLASNGERMILGGFRFAPTVEYTDDMGGTFTAATFPATGSPNPQCARFCGGTRWLVGCTAGTASTGLFMSTDNGASFAAVALPHIININPGGIAIDGVSGRCVVYGQEVGTATNRGYWTDDYVTWNAISFTGTDAKSTVFPLFPPDGYTAPSGTELPDSPGHYVDDDGVVNGPGGTTVDRCTPELGTDIVADLCARREVTDIDVSELTDLVDGFKVATETDPATAIDSTRAAYFYDASEYDGVIHFPKRGGSPAFALTMDDLAARDGDPIEWERVQEAELLRKVTVAYIDPATTYTQTTQKWERRTGTVEAKGEGSVEIPIVGTKDFAAQVAEKRGKAAWAETDKCRFSLPYKWAKLTPADVGTLTDGLGKVHRIRILSIEDDSGYRHVEAVREQTNTYVSTAVGSSGPNPTYPGSGLAGPTVAAIMNLPVLRDEDDKAGLYIAAAGMLSGWQGALIQMARDGATFENGPIIAANATMGELTATLATASRYVQDNANTLSVRLLPTSGDLSSTTYDGLIESEANSAAILYADGTAEILQFQTATETAPGEYDLTGLMRGRQDTAIASHASGARFVLLDDAIRFAAIKASDVGKTLTFRPVSVGSSPGSNATQTITMTTIQSLREWSPYNVTVTSDGAGGYCVEWIGRARLGTSRTPVHSQWFDGYRVTFSRLGAEHIIDTTEQSACASAADLSDFGGTPYVTVVARSRVATNDDDFASPPGSDPAYPDGGGAPNTGDPMTDPDHSGTWQEQGTPPDGYAGEPYFLIADGRDDYVFKGSTTAAITLGGFTANVGAANSTSTASGDNGLRIRGIPLTAHTAAAAALFNSDLAALETHGGNVTDSITYAAKPTYSLPNWVGRGESYGVGLVATTPPWTTMRVVGTGGALESRAEFNSGTVRAEFTITGVADARLTRIGLVAADPAEPDDSGAVYAGSWSWPVPADGSYAIEVNSGTGAIVVRDTAGASLATHTLMLPVGKVYRFRWGGNEAGVTIKANFGNEAWVGAVTGGYTGVPNMATIVPVQWDGLTNATYQVSSDGDYGPVTNCSGILTAGGVGLLLGSFGKSSGQHRVRFFDASRTDKQRVGLCLTGQTGQLGTTGTSISYRNSNTVERWHELRWTWGGGGVATLPSGFDTAEEGLIHSRPSDVVFAYDAAAAEIEVWIAEQDQYNVMKALRYWTTITGVPAGTYWPALYADFQGAASLYHNADEPSGYSDWTLTL